MSDKLVIRTPNTRQQNLDRFNRLLQKHVALNLQLIEGDDGYYKIFKPVTSRTQAVAKFIAFRLIHDGTPSVSIDVEPEGWLSLCWLASPLEVEVTIFDDAYEDSELKIEIRVFFTDPDTHERQTIFDRQMNRFDFADGGYILAEEWLYQLNEHCHYWAL